MPTIAHQQTIRRADAVADAAERAVHRWWRDLLAIIRAGPNLGLTRLHATALAHFRRLRPLIRQEILNGFADLYLWANRTAARTLVRTIPVDRLADVARGRSLRESRLLERVPEFPGLLRFFLRPSGLGIDRTMRVLSGPDFEELSDAEKRQLFQEILFPPPTEGTVQARLNRLIAPFLLEPRPDLVPPERLAAMLTQSYAQGKTQKDIAADLLPHAEGVRASARRVARTWGMHVAAESERDAHESIGELVIGYQIHATPGPFSRPWHQDRSGTVYYKNPGPGQKGFAQMPRPPLEAPDASERPLGAPALAWNCLCWLTPVLAAPE